MSKPPTEKSTPEYQTGYMAGYRAGLQRIGQTHTYQRVYWQCTTCDATGLVLWRNDDDNQTKQWRLDQSHAAQIRRTRCHHPQLVRLTARQVRRIVPTSEPLSAAERV